MNLYGGWRSWSGRTIVLVALAAAYYIALNAVLIHELVDRVQAGQLTPIPARSRVEAPQTTSSACADLGQLDRDICKAEAMIARASATLREQRRERRAAHEEHRTASAQ